MDKIRHMTFQNSLDLNIDGFERAVMIRYLEYQPEKKATEQELEDLLVWTYSSRTDGAILDGMLWGDLQVQLYDGQLSCRLIPLPAEPEENAVNIQQGEK